MYVRYNVHMKKIYYTATEARKNWFKILRDAGKPGHEIIITRKGKDPIILMPEEELEEWKETLEVMSDPQLVKDIEEARKESGGTPLDKVIKELGWEE